MVMSILGAQVYVIKSYDFPKQAHMKWPQIQHTYMLALKCSLKQGGSQGGTMQGMPINQVHF